MGRGRPRIDDKKRATQRSVTLTNEEWEDYDAMVRLGFLPSTLRELLSPIIREKKLLMSPKERERYARELENQVLELRKLGDRLDKRKEEVLKENSELMTLFQKRLRQGSNHKGNLVWVKNNFDKLTVIFPGLSEAEVLEQIEVIWDPKNLVSK